MDRRGVTRERKSTGEYVSASTGKLRASGRARAQFNFHTLVLADPNSRPLEVARLVTLRLHEFRVRRLGELEEVRWRGGDFAHRDAVTPVSHALLALTHLPERTIPRRRRRRFVAHALAIHRIRVRPVEGHRLVRIDGD